MIAGLLGSFLRRGRLTQRLGPAVRSRTAIPARRNSLSRAGRLPGAARRQSGVGTRRPCRFLRLTGHADATRRPALPSALGGSLARELAVREALAERADHQAAHLLGGVRAAAVVPARELRHVALQVLGAHAVVGAIQAALQQRPERFQTVGVRLAAHVLAHRVLHCLVREALHRGVGLGVARVHLRARLDPLPHEALQLVCVF